MLLFQPSATVLAKMSGQEGSSADGERRLSEMQLLLQDEGVDLEVDGPRDHDPGWRELIEELMNFKELSHAEINRKRKRRTFAAFQDANIDAKITATEALVSPNMRKIGTLLSRTHAIATIPRLPRMAKAERADLESKSCGKCCSNFFGRLDHIGTG